MQYQIAISTRPQNGKILGNYLTMDDPNNLATPRKRLKLQHPSTNYNMDGVSETPMANTVSAKDQSATPSIDKEAECGITEYVDRHKPGFSAILKKRSEHLVLISRLLTLNVVGTRTSWSTRYCLLETLSTSPI